jgi:hypothetical protein
MMQLPPGGRDTMTPSNAAQAEHQRAFVWLLALLAAFLWTLIFLGSVYEFGVFASKLPDLSLVHDGQVLIIPLITLLLHTGYAVIALVSLYQIYRWKRWGVYVLAVSTVCMVAYDVARGTVWVEWALLLVAVTVVFVYLLRREWANYH